MTIFIRNRKKAQNFISSRHLVYKLVERKTDLNLVLVVHPGQVVDTDPVLDSVRAKDLHRAEDTRQVVSEDNFHHSDLYLHEVVGMWCWCLTNLVRHSFGFLQEQLVFVVVVESLAKKNQTHAEMK